MGRVFRGLVVGGLLAAAVAMAVRRPRARRFAMAVNRRFLHQLTDWVASRLGLA
jgi:hypothetical protein